MAVLSFDTLATTRSLERCGLPRAQAESITDIVRQAADAWAANLATKDDLAAFRADMKANMVTKADLAALKAELFHMLWVQSVCVVTVTLTGVGVLLTMFRMA